MRKFIIPVILALSLMTGCGNIPYQNRGKYNLGVCTPDSYLALHVSMKGNTIILTTIQIGFTEQQPLDKPDVFKYTFTDSEGYLHFQDGHDVELALKFAQDGTTSGVMSLFNQKVAFLGGAKGSLDKLPEDGLKGYYSCRDYREGQ